MANYSTLKAAVADVVKTNGSQAITGANLQTVLLSIINSIGGGGYIFNGVATPSTDAGTPDQNVFYIGGAGTYANFGTSVVVPPTNIAVFKYNGSWVCEQVTVENGGVFDISAFKAVGGTLATYADLAAALGTNGANVPQSLRKGGMSVKFVCSYDNKYVQARCMSQNFTTDVTQWQGVDTTPTVNSKNLVESGGVSTFVVKKINQNLNVPDNFAVGYELTSGGGISQNPLYTTSGKMYMNDGLEYYTDYQGNIYCYHDETHFLGRVKSGNNLIEGTVYVKINWPSANEAPYFMSIKGEPLQLQIDGIDTALVKTKSDAFDLNSEEGRRNGNELNALGQIVPNPDFVVSRDIEVSSNLLYETNCKRRIYCYGDNGYINRVYAGSPLLENTKYIRMNWALAEEAPYFISYKDDSLQVQIEKQDTAIRSDIEHIYQDVFCNLNNEENFHVGEELLRRNGSYSSNPLYTASGDIILHESLNYKTNHRGNIFCYNNSGFIGVKSSGEELFDGTTFVRLNWLSTDEAPYFYSFEENGLQYKINPIKISEQKKINGDDFLRNELTSTGGMEPNDKWRVSQFVVLKNGYTYKSNVTQNHYFYGENGNYISRLRIEAGTAFSRSTVDGAETVRTNSPMDTPIEFYEYKDGIQELVDNINISGIAKNVMTDYSVKHITETKLPLTSSNVKIQFKTGTSLYKQPQPIELVNIGNGMIVVKVNPRTISDNIFVEKCEADVDVFFAGVKQTIPLRLNNYGYPLFSIRIKYPVVEFSERDDTGRATIITPMPSEYQGMYIQKTDTVFTIYNSDDTVFKSWVLNNYADVEAFVDALLLDTALTPIFSIEKYGCEGVLCSEINNFEKIILSKETQEISFAEDSNGNVVYTGQVYWDSYPTFIRKTDVGYEHTLKINYRYVDGIISDAFISFDGMFLKFNNSAGGAELPIAFNTNIITEILGVTIEPYKKNVIPVMSMQHKVIVSDSRNQQTMITTTLRLKTILSYLQEHNAYGVNASEYMSVVRGTNAINNNVYCLTFDDQRKELWTNEEIRTIFNQFRAKPTLVEVIQPGGLNANTPPNSNISSDEYKAIKASGWDVISHGFCLHTGQLSYGQFMYGFGKVKERWQQWYGEDIQSYNPHGQEITDFQFYLLKRIGFNSISSGTALLGWFCECDCPVDIQYKRITFMDGDLPWTYVKKALDKLFN